MRMRMATGICAGVLLLGSTPLSAAKPHFVGFGKWTSIKLIQEGEDKRTGDGKDFECATPIWRRDPARVIFEPKNQAKFTYTRSRAVDLVSNSDADDGEE